MNEHIPGRSADPTEAQVITGKRNIRIYHMLSQKYAMMLEEKGLKHSKGSVTAHVKRQYGFKGNRSSVIQQLQDLIDRVHRGEVELP
jgi:hypothetical protein